MMEGLRELAEAGNEAQMEALNQSINPSLAYKPSNTAYAPIGPYLNPTSSTMSIDVRRGENPGTCICYELRSTRASQRYAWTQLTI